MKTGIFNRRNFCYLSKVNQLLLPMKYNRCSLVLALFLFTANLQAQLTDSVYRANIRSVRFHIYGDQEGLPVYNLNSSDRLELHFDDMDANYKNYYYTFQLCDYNWQPVTILNPFDYIKGFTQMRITNYRYSSIAFTKYTHYQAILPETNSMPSKSGNFIVKVYLDGDSTKLVFTRRMLVLDQKVSIGARVSQPFTPQLFNTHQKIIFSTDIKSLNAFTASQQVKAVILQNNKWTDAIRDIPPTFIRGTLLEYNTENNCIFPGGKEWRWLDLRSFRLLSDRVDSGEYKKATAKIYVKPDADRSGQKYTYYRDVNGMYLPITYETINPYTQGEYADVYFTFLTPDGKPLANKNIYLFGQLTDYKLNESTKMIFNEEKGYYEGHAFLKQGYYSYEYFVTDNKGSYLPNLLEGNYYETENTYTVLLYYKGFSDRTDQLIGISKIDSRTDRPGFSF